MLAAGEKMGDAGSPLTLKFRVKIGDAEHVLVLDCTIRSVNASRPTVDENLTLLHGLSFDNVNSQDTLVISALLYQNMISAQEVER